MQRKSSKMKMMTNIIISHSVGSSMTKWMTRSIYKQWKKECNEGRVSVFRRNKNYWRHFKIKNDSSLHMLLTFKCLY